jgi:putative nucleotidyltransferase with HDIG domain
VHGEIVAKYGKSKGRRFPIQEGQTLTIGRGLRADIQIFDDGLSRVHCSIENRGDAFIVSDKESANGTYLNGKAIASADAYDGDEVSIGLAILSLVGPKRPEEGRGSQSSRHKTTTLTVLAASKDGTHMKKLDPGDAEMLKADEDATLAGLRRAHRDLATIYRISNAINALTDPHELADTLVETLIEVTNADHAAAILGAVEGDEVEPYASSRRGAEGPSKVRVSRTVVTEVMRKGVSVISTNVPEDKRYASGDSLVMQQIKSMMCVPLLAQSEVIGALYVDSRSGTDVFSDQDLELLAAVGNQAGVALQRVKLLADLENLFFSSMRSLVAAIDRKDQYTHGHSERVTTFAMKIAKEVGVSDHERDVLQLAGLLHDVGKIGIPEYVLNKPGELTDEEYAKVTLHPVHGAEIISNIQSPYVPEIAAAVRHHHEHWDGSGYPEHLKGEDVPRVARILALADSFDAMTSDRPYRKGFPMDRAVKIVQECAGTQFDPELAEIVVGLHERGELFLPDTMAHKYTTMASRGGKE